MKEVRLLALFPPELWLGAQPHAGSPHYNKDRGMERLLNRMQLCSRQRCAMSDPTTCPQVRLQALQGSLRTVLGWLERADPLPQAAPRLVMQAPDDF